MKYVIADDLTGANDTAIQFRNLGYSVIVPLDVDFSQEVYLADVIAVNTDSREMTPVESYRTVQDSAKAFALASQRDVYKKIDSMLRGNPGSEIEALADYLKASLIFIVPAFPSNGRIIRDGLLITENHAPLDVVALISSQMRRSVASVPAADLDTEELLSVVLSKAREGIEVFVFDTAENSDLDKIAQVAKKLPEYPLCAGSAAFALHWADRHSANFDARQRKPAPAVVVVAGSISRTTKAQILKTVADFGVEPVVFNCKTKDVKGETNRCVGELSVQIRTASVAILTVSSLFDSRFASDGQQKVISDSLGKIVKRAYQGDKVGGFILTGGDTALKVARELGAHGIYPEQELFPGIPFGYLAGGVADGKGVVTKSGGFGTPEVISAYVRFMNGGLK